MDEQTGTHPHQWIPLCQPALIILTILRRIFLAGSSESAHESAGDGYGAGRAAVKAGTQTTCVPCVQISISIFFFFLRVRMCALA